MKKLARHFRVGLALTALFLFGCVGQLPFCVPAPCPGTLICTDETACDCVCFPEN